MSDVPWKAIRAKLERASEDMRTACQMLRDHDHPENADELMRTVKHLRVWTRRDGWLDIIKRQDLEQPASDA